MAGKLSEAVLQETLREKALRDERIAWQAEHSKPWYLQPQKHKDRYDTKTSSTDTEEV